jgi:hypothetical protein
MEININLLAIVESLRPDEVHTGTELADYLRRKPLPIAVELFQPITRDDFVETLNELAERTAAGACSPLVHIEAHGDRTGIETTSGDEVGWQSVGDTLRIINIPMRNSLVVTTAICHGAYVSVAAALNPSKPAPFCGIIGPGTTVLAEHLEKGFRAFFGELLESGDFVTALHELQTRNLPTYRALDMADLFRQGWAAYLKTTVGPVLEERIVKNVARLRRDEIERRGGRERALTMERERLTNYADRRDQRWRTFIMADLYPENLARFAPLEPDV